MRSQLAKVLQASCRSLVPLRDLPGAMRSQLAKVLQVIYFCKKCGKVIALCHILPYNKTHQCTTKQEHTLDHIDFRRELQRRIINSTDGVFLDELWAYILKTCNYRTTGLLLNADQQWSETEDATGTIVPICCLLFRGASSPLLELENRPYLLDLLATLAATGTEALMVVDRVAGTNAVFRWQRQTGWVETSKEIAR